MDYGKFGGQYVPQELKEKLNEIEVEFLKAKEDENFIKEYLYYLKNYVGRPSPLYLAKNLSEYAGGAKIYLKREDLNHTGAHKINNAIGQVLLAKRMGKTHIIAETGAGQHGVATATVCSLFNMKCTIFMGKVDVKKQHVNVEKIKLLGADVVEVAEGCHELHGNDECVRHDIGHESHYIVYVTEETVEHVTAMKTTDAAPTAVEDASKEQLLHHVLYPHAKDCRCPCVGNAEQKVKDV